MPRKEPGITPLWESARRSLKIRNAYVREAIAEAFGVTILCYFAVGAGIQSVTWGSSHLEAVLGGTLGLMVAVLTTGGISGAHLNPAVTLGLAIAGKVSWFKVPLYWISQILGGYFGAGIAVLQYYALVKPSGTLDMQYCGSFASIGQFKLGTGIVDQILCTAVLLIAIYALIDEKNMKVPFHLLPFLIALVVAAMNLTFGVIAGASMNPARDLGPRLMALSIGCPHEVIMESPVYGEQWWLVSFFGPLVGAIVGTFTYILLIGAHVRDEEDHDVDDMELRRNSEFVPGSTRFLPKAQTPTLPPNQAAPINPRHNNGGYNNNGYDGRDDQRFSRSGY